jgi:quercetin dioxygenase-like cupin family protein
MITGRNAALALVALSVGACAGALAEQKTTALRSSVFDWDAIPAKGTPVGAIRPFFRGPTANLDELELHVTTLNAGQTSHAPHRHPNEELVIVKEGTVEVLVSGEWKRVGPGSVIFNAADELHGLKNPGPGPAIYHVINWTVRERPKASQP